MSFYANFWHFETVSFKRVALNVSRTTWDENLLYSFPSFVWQSETQLVYRYYFIGLSRDSYYCGILKIKTKSFPDFRQLIVVMHLINSVECFV